MTKEYLSLTDVAHRIGVTVGTLRSYSNKGMLPKPDVVVGISVNSTRGWLPETIDEWNAKRPGRGHRSDLLPKKHT